MWSVIQLFDGLLKRMSTQVSDPHIGHMVEVQMSCESGDVPSEAQLGRWAMAALDGIDRETPPDPSLPLVCLCLVDEAQSRQLNAQWRGKDYATNVLSFPSAVPGFLGDVVLCAPIIRDEAKEQEKACLDHWAHLVIHGVLHLRGFDHETEEAAHAMESTEALILREFGIINPYESH